MTPDERAALPIKDRLTQGEPFSPYGLRGDDLLGFWQDATGEWFREPRFF